MQRKSTGWILTALIVAVGLVGLPTRVMATTLTLSDLSSDATPAAILDATVDFAITGANELTVTVTNNTSAPNTYNINKIFFNAVANVTGLALDSATHSAEGDVASDWSLNPAQTKAGTFGTFDFALQGPRREGENNPSLIGPGEDIEFVFTISGTGPFDMDDFVESTDPRSGNAACAAAKFVNGQGDDSAFGARMP